MNRYDLEHAVAPHPRMSEQDWTEVYRSAWQAYYTREHMTTLIRRGVASGIGSNRLIGILAIYSRFITIEKPNPLQGAILRIKRRRDRRPGMPLEPAWYFYPKSTFETVSKLGRLLANVGWLHWTYRLARAEQRRKPYTDQALMPVTDAETNTLDLFTHNEAARAAVAQTKKVAELTGAVAAAR